MKELALSINATPIQPPSSISHLSGGLLTGQNIIQTGIQLALLLTVLAALFSVIFAGIQYMTSEGDKQKLQNARHRILYSIIGLAVAFLAFLIINIVGDFFGVKLIGP